MFPRLYVDVRGKIDFQNKTLEYYHQKDVQEF